MNASRIARLYLATKSRETKEEEKVEKLVKPAPTKKPPRHDLRNERITEDDPDLQSSNATNDRDLSLNYKRIAAYYIKKQAGKVLWDAKPKRPGDYWQTRGGNWSVWPQGAEEALSAPDQETAERWSQGKDEEGEPVAEEDILSEEDADGSNTEEETEDSTVKPDKEEPEQRAKEFAKTLKEKFHIDLDDSIQEEISEYLENLDAEELQTAIEDFNSTLDGHKETFKLVNRAEGEEKTNALAVLFDDAEDALKKKPKPGKQIGKQLGNYLFAKRVVTNPTIMGGNSSSEAFANYKHMPKALRQESLNQAAVLLGTLPEDSDERNALEATIDGIALSAYLQGEEVTGEDENGRDIELRPEMADQFKPLLESLDALGQAESLLMPPEDFFGLPGRQAVNQALDYMDDSDLIDFFEDSPYEELARAFESDSIAFLPEQKALVRETLKSLVSNDMTASQAFIKAFSGSPPKKKRYQEVDRSVKPDKVRSKARKHLDIPKTVDSILDCFKKSSVKECRELLKKMIVSDFEGQREELLQHLKSTKIDLTDPYIAKINHVIETGDLSILDEVVVSKKTRR